MKSQTGGIVELRVKKMSICGNDWRKVPHVSCIPCLSVVVDSNYITQDLSCFAFFLYDVWLFNSRYRCVVEMCVYDLGVFHDVLLKGVLPPTLPPYRLIDAATKPRNMETRKVKKGWFQPHQGAEVYVTLSLLQQQLLQTCYDHLEVSLWGIQQDRIALLQLVNMACQSQQNWVECVLWCHISTNRKLKVTPCSPN